MALFRLLSPLTVALLLLPIWPSATAKAQILDLSATHDGRQLYFTLETPTGPQIWRIIETDEVQPFADNAADPQVSWAGTQVGFTQSDTVFILGDLRLLLPGSRMRMSRNSRWLLLHPTASSEPLRIDLSSNTIQSVPADAIAIDSSGTLLLASAALWRNGSRIPLDIPRLAPGPSLHLSGNGTFAFYRATVVSGLGKFTELTWFTIHLPTGAQQVLYTSSILGSTPQDYPQILSSSDDGTLVLLKSSPAEGAPGEAWLARSFASNRKQRIPVPGGELITTGTLSGDGQLAFLTTVSGKLLRIQINTGAAATLLALQ
jgi:hypothetical protein